MHVRSGNFLGFDQVLDKMEKYIVFGQLRTVYCYLYTNISATNANVLYSSGTKEAFSRALLLCPSDIRSTSIITENIHLHAQLTIYFASPEAGNIYFLVGLPYKRLA